MSLPPVNSAPTLFSVTVEDLDTHEERDANLVGFGGVICPFCEDSFKGTFAVGDRHAFFQADLTSMHNRKARSE